MSVIKEDSIIVDVEKGLAWVQTTFVGYKTKILALNETYLVIHNAGYSRTYRNSYGISEYTPANVMIYKILDRKGTHIKGELCIEYETGKKKKSKL